VVRKAPSLWRTGMVRSFIKEELRTRSADGVSGL